MAKVKDVTLEKVEEKEVKKTVKKTTKAKTVTKAKTSVKTAEKKTPAKEVSKTKAPKAKSIEKEKEVKTTVKSTADTKGKRVYVRPDKKKVRGSVIFVRPQAIKMERDENDKAIGLSMSGFQSPDGQYYKINIPFVSEDGKVTGKILTSEESVRFPGWGVITMEDNAVLTMTNVVSGEEATLDKQAFKNFVVNKNRKIEEKLALKQNVVMENKSKMDKSKTHSGVADGR